MHTVSLQPPSVTCRRRLTTQPLSINPPNRRCPLRPPSVAPQQGQAHNSCPKEILEPSGQPWSVHEHLCMSSAEGLPWPPAPHSAGEPTTTVSHEEGSDAPFPTFGCVSSPVVRHIEEGVSSSVTLTQTQAQPSGPSPLHTRCESTPCSSGGGGGSGACGQWNPKLCVSNMA